MKPQGTTSEDSSTLAQAQEIQLAPFGSLTLSFYNAIEPLRDAWLQIEQGGINYPYQSYAWIECFQKTVGRREGIAPCPVLISGPTDEPLLILPLGIYSNNGITRLIWLGGELAGYLCALFTEESLEKMTVSAAETLWETVCNELPPHDAALLEKQPELINGHANPFCFKGSRPHSCNSYWMTLTEPLDDFLRKKHTAKWLKRERRKERRLAEAGDLEFSVAKEPDAIDQAIDTLIIQKRIDFERLGIPDLFRSGLYQEFIRELTLRSSDSGFAQAFSQLVAGQPHATRWGVAYQGRYCALLTAYEHGELSRYSPSNLLLRNILEWCIENELTVFDFGPGDQDFKKEWCENTLQMSDYISGSSIRGRIYAITERARRRIKRYIKTSPRLFATAMRLRAALPG